MTYEDVRECSPVERFIWTHAIALSYSEFEGVHKLTMGELLELKSLCDHQINDLMKEGEQ